MKRLSSTFPNMSFHRQLLLIFSIGITLLAIIASLTTAWVTSRQVRTLLITEGLQVTDNLAEQSILALLYDSGENAMDAVRTTLAFPAIKQVTIFNAAHQVILEQGEGEEHYPVLPEDSFKEPDGNARLATELPGEWHFMAPVYTPGNTASEADALFTAPASKRELLGYVYVIMHKDTLRDIQAATFTNNMAIALGIAAILMLVLNTSLTRLTRPLHTLSRLMGHAENGAQEVYAELHGPQEVAHIASAFNTMMASIAERDTRLREQNLQLETEVSLRTRELVQARDAALEASRHKSEFLSNISHELRTPLQSIIGYTDVLIETLEDEHDEQLLGDLERVMRNAQHLLSLIDTILALAKIEAGRMELNIERVELRQLLDQAEDTVAPLMKTNNNRLQTSLEESEHTLEIDAGKILQVILNLLSNALKFTRDGEVFMRVRHSKSELVIGIEDTGIGISAEQQSIIFDPFRQVDGSSTRHFQGTGLGLSITQRFCQLMGGTIRVDSELGHGATFTVTIPLPLRTTNSKYGTSLDNPVRAIRT
jgi:signal transduction histidine kinase